jgi:predicted MFS family arabinose efflux permease
MIRAMGRLYADAFRGLPARVWRLSAGLFINRAGTMVLPFLSLYLVRELGFETGDASVVLFAFGLGSVAGAYTGGAISGRLGALRVQAGSLILGGAGFLVLSQLRGFAAITLFVFAVSAVGDAFRPACLTAIVEAAPIELRPRAMGLMRLAANAGMAVGPALGGFLAGLDDLWIFVGEAVTCWGAAVWLLGFVGEEAPGPAATPAAVAKARSLWRDGRFLALLGLVFVMALVLFQVFTTMPLYLTSAYGLDETEIGFIFALNAALIVAFEMVLIKLLEHRPPELVLGLGGFLMCAGFGLLPFGHGVAYAAFTVVVWSVGEMLAFPFSNVLVAERAGAGRVGPAMGMYSAVFSAALVAAPVVGLGVLERFGGDVLWTAAGLLAVPLWIAAAALRAWARR